MKYCIYKVNFNLQYYDKLFLFQCLSYFWIQKKFIVFLRMKFLFTFYIQFCEEQCEVQEEEEEEEEEEEVDSALHQPKVELQRV